MRGRTQKAHQLYEAESRLIELGNAADALAMEIGVAGDSIHFDGSEPTPMRETLESVERLRALVESAVGLLRAYEMMRVPGQVI
ncbi:MAG TPA: hypothetical protein VIG24_10655 [Acidimicrobiia bacterium]